MLKVYFRRINAYREVRRIPVLGQFCYLGVPAVRAMTPEDLIWFLGASRFRTQDGVFKLTEKDRFRDLETATVRHLSYAGPHRVHDVAVSSGITSLELFNLLERQHMAFHLTVSDRSSAYSQTGFAVSRIYDEDGRLVEASIFGILALPGLSWRFPVSKLLGIALASRPIRPGTARPLLLFDPRLVDLVDEGRVELIDYDLFKTQVYDRFTFVRCMNVLNRVYFPDDALLQGVLGLRDSLVDGGVLLLGRTDGMGGSNLATFLRRRGARLEVLESVGGGSDILDSLGDLVVGPREAPAPGAESAGP
jgi:hypothetical protein